jgi:hypothetical protein
MVTESPEDMALRAQVMGDISLLPDPAKKGGLYLRLFHGRIRKDEDLDDWGFDGPHLGPLRYVNMTYTSDIKFAFETPEDALKFGFEDEFDCMIDFVEGLLPYKGGFYGDISVYNW